MEVLTPMWVWFATAAIFGCSAYLAMSVAAMVYEKEAPVENGPAPSEVGLVHTLVLVAIAAIVGAVVGARTPSLVSIGVFDLIVFALCAAIWTDVTRGFIGDWFTLPAIALVVVVGYLRHDIATVAISLAVVTAPFALAAVFSKGMGMGWGDVKLVALGGALLQLQTSMLMFAAASMLACGIALATRKRDQPIAFAPYLAAAIAVGIILPNAQNLV